MSHYGVNTSFQAHSTQQHDVSTSAQPPVDANSFFGGASTEVTASSFFGSTTTQSSSQAPDVFGAPEAPQQEHVQQVAPESTTAYAASISASPPPAVEAPTAPSADLQAPEPNKLGEPMSVPAEASAPVVDATEDALPPIANENEAAQAQAFDGFSASGPHGFGDQTSPDFFSAPPQQDAASSYGFENKGYGQQKDQHQQQMYGTAAASAQFAEAHSSYQHSNAAGATTPYGESGMHAPGAPSGSHFSSSAPGAGVASPSSYSQQQQQPQYQQYEQPQHHATAGYGYHGGAATTQLEATAAHLSSEHEYGAAAGHGYGSTSSHQASYQAAAPAVKTSNKYKDPCVAPPSCLASFGFGGNVVTMFPKRKLRLNIAGSSYRNSPRGVQAYVYRWDPDLRGIVAA
jgi:hypothetical protein